MKCKGNGPVQYEIISPIYKVSMSVLCGHLPWLQDCTFNLIWFQ